MSKRKKKVVRFTESEMVDLIENIVNEVKKEKRNTIKESVKRRKHLDDQFLEGIGKTKLKTMYKNLSEEKSRMQKLMGFIYEYNSHDILSEQVIKKSVISEATQGCEQMIFKGNEINVENFGSILNCFDSGGRKFGQVLKMVQNNIF